MKRGMGGRGGEEGENEAAADESETRTPDAGKSQLGLRSPVTTSSAPASAGRRQPALPLTRTRAHTPLAPISRQLLESGPSAPVPHAPGSRSSGPWPSPGPPALFSQPFLPVTRLKRPFPNALAAALAVTPTRRPGHDLCLALGTSHFPSSL